MASNPLTGQSPAPAVFRPAEALPSVSSAAARLAPGQDVAACDASLVARAQAGDSAAYSELVRRHQDRVFNTLYRICRNEADAADLAQAAFVKAYQSLGRFAGKSSFFTWLYRIAVNLALSERRGRARRPLRLVSDIAAGGDDGGGGAGRGDGDSVIRNLEPAGYESPGRRIEEDETRRRIEAALEKLDDDFRAVVVLKDMDGMDYAQIAEVLDLPLGTVKSRIHRGRLMLRDLLGDLAP